MSETWQQVKELFHAVLAAKPGDRRQLLEAADEQVQLEVESLLRAHDEAPPARAVEGAGSQIDRYKLLQEIGQGGFGVVFMAEQLEPVRRKVALKIIKPGMDTKQVVARFEAERQALALMDHPGIAHVFDGGTTPTGRPYFVMELVKGVPVTEYCDQAELDMRARLELFQTICHAVQHAHQKGIIHRDLKPSNVLVTVQDDQPLPKVIDFGIAKATEQRLTEKTLFTEFRQMIGTPEYMAPEQAELTCADVDTRADIYSLGVLLYELLTGTKPFEVKSLLEQGYDELVRTIREIDPPKPSTRVSTLDEQVATHPRRRGMAGRHLGRLLRGDLDWIVMKALEKNRIRRYESASSLAADIERHLAGEPVLAGPPSSWYRAHKYLGRHRLGVTASAAVLVALVIGLILAYGSYREAEDARAREATQRGVAEQRASEAQIEAARARSVRDLIGELLSGGKPFVRGPGYTVRALLDDFDRRLADPLKDQPEVEIFLRLTMARAYLGMQEVLPAGVHFERARELAQQIDEADPDLEHQLLHVQASLQYGRRNYLEASEWYQRLADEYCGEQGEGECSVTATLCDLGQSLARSYQFDEAREVTAEALTRANELGDVALQMEAEQNLADLDMALHEHASAEQRFRKLIAWREARGWAPDPANLQMLALALLGLGRYGEAEAACRQAIEQHRELLGESTPALASDYYTLAQVLLEVGRLDEARRMGEQALEQSRQTGTVDVCAILLLLADIASKQRDPAAAVRWAREGLELTRKLFGEESAMAVPAYNNLALALHASGAKDEAEACLRRAIELNQQFPSSDDEATRRINLGVLLSGKGEYAEGEALCRQGLALLREQVGEDHPDLAIALRGLAGALRVSNPDEAVECYRRALQIVRTTMPRHPMHGGITYELSEVLRAQGRSGERADLLEESVRITLQQPAANRPELVGMLIDLLQTCEALDRPAVGEWAARELLIADESRRTEWLAALARALNAQEKYAAAEPFARESLQLAEEQPPSWPRILARCVLGATLIGTGDLEAAEPLLLEVHEALDHEPTDPPALRAAQRAEVRALLVHLYEQWNEPEEVAYWSGLPER